MPHQCTGCGHVFPDGSKEMLSGCPECGGNKFQFQPDSAIDGNGAAGGSDAADGDSSGGTPSAPTDAPPEPPDPPSPGGSVAETVAGAAKSVRNIVGSGRSESPSDAAGGAADREWPDVDRADATPDQPSEDAAQAGARSATVSPEELTDHD